MSTLWANGDKGFKSISGQQCSVQEVYPTPPSSSRKNWQRQHFFTILLHSRWTNVHIMGKWSQGLKIDLAATKQCTVLFNLTQEVFPAPPSSSSKNSLSRHFFTILLHSRWRNVHFMGKWWQGLKIDLGATKQRKVIFKPRPRILPNPTTLFKKKIAKSAFFYKFASFQVNKCPLYGQMETGA